ncbi:acetylglutamate kinase [Kroppenstedtia sanguinis]|uniref:acetylglutamate kinase n=1 Tax=Kroppenstedtia sanguinis TaxID=1380684 RepID=UPI003D25C04D
MDFRPLVIKIGGSVLERLHSSFFQECGQLMEQGYHPVVIHGGGPEISRIQKRLGLSARFVDGLRMTDDEGLKVVEMVLAGRINKSLTARFWASQISVVGISGADGGLLQVKPKDPALGWVGEVTAVHPRLLYSLWESGWIPVVASLGLDNSGNRYNVNADTAAGAIAQELAAERLILVTDVPGIWKREGEIKKFLSQVTPEQVQKMIQSGEIAGGMIPKVRAALAGLEATRRGVLITDGSIPGCLGSETGTRIVKEATSDDVVPHLSTK